MNPAPYTVSMPAGSMARTFGKMLAVTLVLGVALSVWLTSSVLTSQSEDVDTLTHELSVTQTTLEETERKLEKARAKVKELKEKTSTN